MECKDVCALSVNILEIIQEKLIRNVLFDLTHCTGILFLISVSVIRTIKKLL